MSKQQRAWNMQYRSGSFLSRDDQPQKSVLKFFRWLKKTHKIRLESSRVLDLGCGVGRNSNYCADRGAKVVGYEFSAVALDHAKERAFEASLDVDYQLRNIGEPYPLKDKSMDIVLDVTSSNSLNDDERAVYIQELSRVVAPGGFVFVRALAKDGDTNAQRLINDYPSGQYDSYIHPDLGVTERVFSKQDFIDLYNPFFTIEHLQRGKGYQTFAHKRYKRNYWIAYMRRR